MHKEVPACLLCHSATVFVLWCAALAGDVMAQTGRTGSTYSTDLNGREQSVMSVQEQSVASHPGIAWNGMIDALQRADKTAVLTYFAAPGKYDPIFTAMGANMKKMALALSGFNVIELTPTYAVAVVNQADLSGTVSQHYVTFIYRDGRWQIVDL